jgi:predicted GTPase
VNQLRETYNFEGAPLRLSLRANRTKRKSHPKPKE